MTRRTMLIAISQMAAAATLASCSRSVDHAATVAANPDLELLASIAYDIVPYAELPPELYVRAAQKMLDATSDVVIAGLEKLRGAVLATPWKDVAEAERVKLLTALEGTPFFIMVRAGTLQTVLRDPATFAIVGYGGSSMEYGGYLGRGFNDIAWLPAAADK